MIRSVIIDDEAHCRESLQVELKNHCPMVEIVGEASSAMEGLELIQKLDPQLVFLDIEMPWASGFELLEKLDSISFNLIFVTGYDQYAIKAFKFSAIDYLLKPVVSTELVNAVNKVKKNKAPLSLNHLDLLLDNLKGQQSEFEKIALPTSESIEFVNVADIIRCASDGNYCSVYLQNKQKIFLAKTLKDIESLLVDHNFIRIHNSHLVAERYISRYIKADGGEVEMIDGSRVPISRSRKNEFMQRFK